MRKWGNSLAEAESEGGAYTPFDTRGRGRYDSSFYVDDQFEGAAAVIPAVDTSGFSRMVLDFQPIRTTLTIYINGVAASLDEWNITPAAAGRVSVNWISGEVWFYPSDVGKSLAGTKYKHFGTVIDTHSFNRLQVAAQAATEGLAGKADVSYVDAGDSSVVAYVDSALAGKADASHNHSAADIISGTLADARLSVNVPRLNQMNAFAWNNPSDNTVLSAENTRSGSGRGEIAVKGFSGAGFTLFEGSTIRWFIGDAGYGAGGGKGMIFYGYESPGGTVFELEGGTNKSCNFHASGTGGHAFKHAGVDRFKVNSTGIGFFNTAPVAKQSITTAAAVDHEAAITQIQNILIAFGLATDNR